MCWRAFILLSLAALESFAAPPVAFDLKGVEARPLERIETKAMVLLFLAVECPIANLYAPTYRRLAEEFKEVQFIAVYPNKDETPEAIRAHLKEYKLPFEALRDTRHELVRAAGAKVTPEAAVYVPGGRLVYLGRIDNRHVSFGKKRPEATEHDLRDALGKISRGEIPELRSSPGIGCSIPPLQ